ncbi:MAG: MFS transporter [Candidatus Omnitrophota bacterium]|jgi:sugar phosphate permease|nr:MAG: MFS transporter [Candidatus Omnitrophota bacterium]
MNDTKPSQYRWLVFGLLAIGYLLVNFHRLCPAVVALDLMQDLQAGGWLVGLLASAYFYPYAFMQIPSGLLSDSWGPRKTITGFFILAGFSSMGFGLAHTATGAIAARVFVGIGVSMLFVPIMKILTRWFTVSEFSFMTGLLMAIGGLGGLIAAYPLAYLSAAIGWRGSFIAIGIITLFSAAAIWLFVRNSPEEMGLAAVETSDPAQPSPKPIIGLWEGVGVVLRAARFWPLAAWFFFTFGIFFSFSGLWGGPYFMEIYQLSKTQAGSILSMPAAAIIIGGPLFSYVSDHILRSRKITLILSSAIVGMLSIPLAFFTADMPLPVLYVWSFLLGMFGSAVVVVGFAAAKESFPMEIAGTAVGLINLFPFLGGAILQPLVGYVLDADGKAATGYSAAAYGQAFQLYVLCAILAFIAACGMKETLPSRRS